MLLLINTNIIIYLAYDRYVKLWDTETGDCIKSFTNHKVLYCVKFNPEEEKQHLFVAGTADKKIVCVSNKCLFFLLKKKNTSI